VLDLVMPEMTGWEFRIEQKKQPSWASIPVLAMSGDHSPQAKAIDASAYLGKPVEDAAFLDAVGRLAKDLHENRALARAGELQRLISLGSLIGGVAHEINNPLAFIDGSLELLQRQLVALIDPSGPGERLAVASALRALERAKVGVERIADVVRCVSLFASADQTTDAPLNVHDVLESSLQVARNEIRHCALVERNYQAIPLAHGNPAKLGQVFLNVILNAVRAIRAMSQFEQLISVKTRATAGRLSVTISDSATVLDAAQSALFDPLTSISEARLGLHFGLAVSREIVQAMGGRIEVRNNHPRGASFCIELPSYSSERLAPPATHRLLLRPRDRVCIMVVDDDPLMCEVLAAMLSSDYEVSAFTSPRAALAAMLEGDVELILCDVMMPDLSGIDLYERLVRERPELASRFIFLTGGAFTERARIFLKRIDRPVIAKPFSRHQLFDVIQQTLLLSLDARAAND
jgi:signal transduction histidine kinase/ActR/RegA family two-component response regulator